jgi:hypothetical protein
MIIVFAKYEANMNDTNKLADVIGDSIKPSVEFYGTLGFIEQKFKRSKIAVENKFVRFCRPLHGLAWLPKLT